MLCFLQKFLRIGHIGFFFVLIVEINMTSCSTEFNEDLGISIDNTKLFLPVTVRNF